MKMQTDKDVPVPYTPEDTDYPLPYDWQDVVVLWGCVLTGIATAIIVFA